MELDFSKQICAHAPSKSYERFTPAHVLEAIREFYAPGANSQNRRTAEQFIDDFQRSEVAVVVSLKLLASQNLSQPLPIEACRLLAVSVRRRLQKGLVSIDIPPEEVLKLAANLFSRDKQAAEMLVRAVVVQWIHMNALPLESLIAEAKTCQGVSALVAFEALKAFPEEVKSTDLKIDSKIRTTVLMGISSATPHILRTIALDDSVELAELRLGVATQWCSVCEFGNDVIDVLANSPLLQLASNVLIRGQPYSGSGAEFLETLLEKSGSINPCPFQLIDSLLRVLAATNPDGFHEKQLLCTLVASAVDSWLKFFIAPDVTPNGAWIGLLTALINCCTWGHIAAASTLSTWLGFRKHIMKVGACDLYAPVLGSAVRALRSAAIFPANFATAPAEYQESFIEYRRALRDALREFSSDKVNRSAFIQELSSDIKERINGPWEPLEEAVHALSTPAKIVCDTSTADASDAASTAIANIVLELLTILVVEGSPLFASDCHRQLACTFIMCASVYTPILSRASLVGRILTLARASLSVWEIPLGVDAAFPFTSKQDHVGVVCLLRLCNSCFNDPALATPEIFAELNSDVRKHLEATLAGKAVATLEEHSTIILAQAIATLAAHGSHSTRELLITCLSVVEKSCESGSEIPLYAAAEVVSKCGKTQSEALAQVVNDAWSLLGDVRLNAKALSRFLAIAAETLPARSLHPLVKLVANLFEHKAETRTPLLDTATSLAHRAGKEESVSGLVAELVSGLSALVWKEVDGCDQAARRLRFVVGSSVCLPDEVDEALVVSIEHRNLIEACSRLAEEAAKHSSVVLMDASALNGLALAIRAAASLVAAPARDPPTKSLSLLALTWGDRSALVKDIMNTPLAAEDSRAWPLGAIILRATMKALLGQMPANALGVIVPAARGVFQYGSDCTEGWTELAASGDGFPTAHMKPDSKAQAMINLVKTSGDAQKFKAELKKFCGGKKKSS